MAARPTAVAEESLTSSDAAIGASAMRKATLHLIPLIALGYGAAYIDRVNISFASLQMNRDLHFSATVYGFGAGLFFLSYAACEVPSNLLLYRFGARRWLARIMLTWGLLAIAILFVRTPWQFYTARFFLGMAEAGYFPGVLFYLMQWFPPDLRARTISRFYISLPLSSALMGLVAGALLNLNGRLGLAGWQWLFLIEGIPPVLLGIAFLLLLPDTPAHAKWLTEAERSWIIRNANQASPETAHHTESIRHALLDSRVWQIGIFELLMLGTTYGYIFIVPLLVQQSTHLSIAKVGYITAGLGLLGVPAMLLGATYSDRAERHDRLTKRRADDRYWHIIPGCVLMAVGLAICGLSTAPIIVLPALSLVFIAYNAIQGPFWSLPPSFFTGKSSAAAIAAVNTIGITGGFFGPYYMGLAKDLTGDYQRGLITLSIPMLLAAGVMLYLRRKAQRSNAPDLQPSTATER
jgi:ACS family tartrate transporter-like MFS transporter